MEHELNLSRQSKLVPEDKFASYTFKIFGVGSVGSHVAKILAKTGAKNIHLFDMDTVDDENIAAQAYDFRHIGMNKVDAMRSILIESSGVEPQVFHGQIDAESVIAPEPNTIYMCFFDSFEARRLLFNKLKDFPVIFADGRIGKFDMRYYLTDCSDEVAKKVYDDSLNVTASSELVCGEKASAPINCIIAGMIVMNIVNYISSKDYNKIYIGNAENSSNSFAITKKVA